MALCAQEHHLLMSNGIAGHREKIPSRSWVQTCSDADVRAKMTSELDTDLLPVKVSPPRLPSHLTLICLGTGTAAAMLV